MQLREIWFGDMFGGGVVERLLRRSAGRVRQAFQIGNQEDR